MSLSANINIFIFLNMYQLIGLFSHMDFIFLLLFMSAMFLLDARHCEFALLGDR